MLEGAFDRGPFPLRRIVLDDVLDDFFFDPSYRTACRSRARRPQPGRSSTSTSAARSPTFRSPGMPHLASGITFEYEGRPVLATPDLKEPVIAVIDMEDLEDDPAHRHRRPGLLHAQPREHALCLDRRVARARTATRSRSSTSGRSRSSGRCGRRRARPPRTSSSPATADMPWSASAEMDGALVVYDAATFTEVKRLPMVQAVGKIQCLQQDQPVFGHKSLSRRRRPSPMLPSFSSVTARRREPSTWPVSIATPPALVASEGFAEVHVAMLHGPVCGRARSSAASGAGRSSSSR